jgi:hydrophobic/amphiphilic exporter-1 (mainly G- bacteria), HAE1 family
LNISETFIRRPIATSLLMAAIALFGIVAYRALPVSDLPNVDYPTLNVNASLPGGDPATMASAVATPLERQFTGIAGLDSMTSRSSMGSCNITLQFDLDRDIDGAAVDVQTAIAEAMPLLPAGMPAPPSFRKFNPADQPIMSLALTSKSLPMWDVDEYAQTFVAQRISMVEGVAQVNVWGSQKYAVRVQVDPDALKGRQLGLNEVAQSLQGWNVNLPTGTLFGPHTSYNIKASGQLMKAADYRPIVVAWRHGTPIRLQDVATVKDSVEDERNSSWVNTAESTDRAVNLMVMRQPGTNTIEVTDEVRRLLPVFQSQLPPAVKLLMRSDRSKNIRQSFRDIQTTMVVTLVLVILVIYLFLRNISATLIPSMALPFSIMGTFAVMSVLGYSLNNLSMMALILSIGFVVDDAIVMLENIVRHMEKGETAREAALNGSREIGFTIVSMTLSLAAVFIPVLFMGGILGRLFKEFAATICTAILISGLVSITLTPMLCSRFLRKTAPEKQSWFNRAMQRVFDTMLAGYKWTLWRVLKHHYIMAVVFVAIAGATVYLFGAVSKGFIPEADNDSMNVTVEAAQGTSYYKMVEHIQRVANVLRRDPNIDSFQTSAGGGGGGGFGGGGTTSQMMVQLKPRKQRKKSVNEVINDLRPQVSRFPGLRVFMTAPPAIRIGGRMGKSSYDFTVQGPDTDELYKQAAILEKEVAKLPALVDVTTDLQVRNPQVNIEIDRDRAAVLGLNATQIENVLNSAFGPRWASTIYAPTNQYRVLLEIQPKYQAFADYLSKIYFKSSNGMLVPLDNFASLRPTAGPQSIAHSGQLPSVSISFNMKPGVSLGDAVKMVQETARQTLPANITTSFEGTAKAFQSSMKNLTILLIVALGVVYIVLGVLYESYIHPLTILSGLPSAGVGALLTLMIFKVDLNIYSFVGLMMLIGIVKKNAIMQIDFALEAERKEGKSPAEAIYEGCLTRFRPIMMTTMAAMLGAVPISLGYGSGGEARRPLGLAVIGGLMFSQLITLYLTPVVYSYMAAALNWWRRRRAPALGAIDHRAGALTGAD